MDDIKHETPDQAHTPEQDAPNTDQISEEATVDRESSNDMDNQQDAGTGDPAQLSDQLLRTLAEMENLRRRTEREVGDARVYAVTNFARDMLTIGDNLRRALDAIPEQERNNCNSALGTLLDGVEMTEREFLNILEKHKIRRIEPINERFDPNFHQAMFEVHSNESPAGTVAQIIQAGYVIGERVLRPALVGVSKGKESETNASGADTTNPVTQEIIRPEENGQVTGSHVDKSA